jgi:hypothetical protein
VKQGGKEERRLWDVPSVCVLVELQTVDAPLPVHAAQVTPYLKLSSLAVLSLLSSSPPCFSTLGCSPS